MSKESIWDIAIKKNEMVSKNDSGERTLIFAGSKSSLKRFAVGIEQPLIPIQQCSFSVISGFMRPNGGKSKIIQRFLDQTDTVKKTLALEYSFGRKSGRSLSKDICHIWELGGGVLFTNLLNTYLGKTKNVTLVLVLDLSSPETIWNVLDTTLQTVYNILKKKELSGDFEPCGNKLNDGHEDNEYLTPFPMPLVIVGGKYDLFESFEPEKRKLTCKTLRQVAHSLAGSLVFYSDKDSALVKKMKEILHHHGFGGSHWKGYITDYNKPLLIPFGTDSFQQMEVNKNSLPLKNKGLLLERFKHTYTTLFRQDADLEDLNIQDDPAKNPNFKEPIIDLLRSQKDEELERYRLEKEQREKITSKISS